MSRIARWTRIPDGSSLHVSVDGGDGFSVKAKFHDDLDFEEEWTHAKLVAGPVVRALRTPRLYVARVTISFSKKATATVSAKVVKPGGGTVGTAYTSPPLSASSGAKIVTIFAITKQS